MSEVYVPQGAKQFNEKAIRQVIESQGCIWMAPKIDGIRCTLTWQGGALTALSRSNKPIASLSKWLDVPYIQCVEEGNMHLTHNGIKAVVPCDDIMFHDSDTFFI